MVGDLVLKDGVDIASGGGFHSCMYVSSPKRLSIPRSSGADYLGAWSPAAAKYGSC